MTKTPYPGMTKNEYKRLLKKSKVVLSFVGEKYVKQYPSMMREIESQHRRNAEKLVKDNIKIGDLVVKNKKKVIFFLTNSYNKDIML